MIYTILLNKPLSEPLCSGDGHIVVREETIIMGKKVISWDKKKWSSIIALYWSVVALLFKGKREHEPCQQNVHNGDVISYAT